eukprot:TRINITY_DN22527_c0_g1_i1.p1 TRINITY_DN22527_c0_g1~~TRINITY_DN22527_c0_g1_i1.p1  ORF type:complete len:100 (-),score=8.25 TRINITY_DN22527_c0_g1_i1:60-359(-)
MLNVNLSFEEEVKGLLGWVGYWFFCGVSVRGRGVQIQFMRRGRYFLVVARCPGEHPREEIQLTFALFYSLRENTPQTNTPPNTRPLRRHNHHRNHSHQH